MDLYSFINESIERLKRIETHQQACLDGLEMSRSTLIDEVRSNVQKLRTYMNNCRAILLNINPILRKMCGSPLNDIDYYSYNYFSDWSNNEYVLVFFFVYGMFHITQCISFLNIPRRDFEEFNA